jgi:hypothetical protein
MFRNLKNDCATRKETVRKSDVDEGLDRSSETTGGCYLCAKGHDQKIQLGHTAVVLACSGIPGEEPLLLGGCVMWWCPYARTDQDARSRGSRNLGGAASGALESIHSKLKLLNKEGS